MPAHSSILALDQRLTLVLKAWHVIKAGTDVGRPYYFLNMSFRKPIVPLPLAE